MGSGIGSEAATASNHTCDYPLCGEKDDYLLFIGGANPDKNPPGRSKWPAAAERRLKMLVKRSEPPERDYWRRQVEPRLGEDVEVLEELGRDALVLVGAAERGRRSGTVEVYRIAAWDGDREALQAAVADAVTGYVGMDLLVEVAGGLGALTAPTVVVEAEPATSQPSEALSPRGAAALERALELPRTEVAALVEEQQGTRRPSTYTQEKANATP